MRFHGKLVRGWVLGPTEDVPARMLDVHDVVSPVRFFDERRLELLRWVSERYVTPLSTAIERSVPPRVASEETREVPARPAAGAAAGRLGAYANADAVVEAVAGPGATLLLRPAPGEETVVAVACVAAALAASRSAVVVVPEADPEPATVRAIVEAFGEDVAWFSGGSKRSRYRMWLDIAGGRYRIVVGTRAAVFAPVADLGLVYVAREHHALHREERSPSYHVRDVAAARARIEGGAAVLAATMPSLEARSLSSVVVEPVRRRWPPVEVVRPGPEGRAPRLVRALREARRAFVYEPFRGYGVARVCKACGEPAACAVCGGVLRSEAGEIRCTVCEAPGRCACCGASDLGVIRGGAERVQEWVAGLTDVPVTRIAQDDVPHPPGEREIVVGGLDAVKDFGAVGADLVAILGADATLRRPGVGARDDALGVWAEVVAWVGEDGRAIVQTTHPNDPVVQALVSGNPERAGRLERPRRAAAGFPVGAPVFRVVGTAELEPALRALPHTTMLVSELGDATVCLVVLPLDDVRAWGESVRSLAARGVVTRVDAEPHL